MQSSRHLSPIVGNELIKEVAVGIYESGAAVRVRLQQNGKKGLNIDNLTF
jgi:hypothetical protein